MAASHLNHKFTRLPLHWNLTTCPERVSLYYYESWQAFQVFMVSYRPHIDMLKQQLNIFNRPKTCCVAFLLTCQLKYGWLLNSTNSLSHSAFYQNLQYRSARVNVSAKIFNSVRIYITLTLCTIIKPILKSMYVKN